MTSLLLAHCAEPRLGGPAGGPPALAADRERAFSALLAQAGEASARAVLVAGRLLEPGPLDAAGLALVERILEQARAARLPVLVTAEEEPAGWLLRLAEHGLLRLLACRREPAAPLPESELAGAWRVVGLGRPDDPALLAARLRALDDVPDPGRRILLAGGDLLLPPEALAGRVAYAALGGARAATSLPAPAHDPGPLTRLDWSAAAGEDEPGFVLVELGAAAPRRRRRSVPQRPLVVVRVDAAEAAENAEAAFAAALEPGSLAAAAAQPLLRIEVTGELAPGSVLDPELLLAAARDMVDPLLGGLRITAAATTDDGDPVTADSDRATIESAVLARLAAGRGRAFVVLARELLDRAGKGPLDATEVAARIERAISAEPETFGAAG